MNIGGIQTALNKNLSDIISWLKVNFLMLNLKKKMYYLEFRTKNCTDTTLDINTLPSGHTEMHDCSPMRC